MNNYEIRKVKKDDDKKLAFIQVESWKKAYSSIVPQEHLRKFLDNDYVSSIYRRLLDNHKGNGYIMKVDGQYHCIAYWDKARDSITDDTAEIICIHSLPNNWRRGYGSIMMQKLLHDMKEQGYSKVVLWVFRDNERACSFYEACGFRKTGESKESMGAIEISYIRDLQ